MVKREEESKTGVNILSALDLSSVRYLSLHVSKKTSVVASSVFFCIMQGCI